jgi:hypothetical protein
MAWRGDIPGETAAFPATQMERRRKHRRKEGRKQHEWVVSEM